MYKLRKNKISVKKIAEFLKTNYKEKDFDVTSISSLNNIKNDSILFYTSTINFKFKLKDNAEYDLKQLEKFKNIILIASKEIKTKTNIPIIISKNPRLDFQRVVMEFFSDEEFKTGIHKTAIIEDDVIIGKDVFIGSNCYIGNGVEIGDKTKILQNTCVYGRTKIGKGTIIKSNTTIGSEGFSFSFTGDELFHFPHVGSIRIGENVWIGSNCTVEKSQIDETVIEDHVKIDDLVHVGHNSKIKKFSQSTVGSIIGGRVTIGQECWIAPHVVIDTGIEVGENSLIGTSSFVKADVEKNSIMIGSPAKLLRKNV
jgi:UDP-3-O-[3-hydroxymyristoyl] glucosamine N-acyltransferase